jgi:methionine-rich copper-binding protein CopC
MRNQVQPVKIMMTSNEAVSNSVQFSSVGLTQTAPNTHSSRQQKRRTNEQNITIESNKSELNAS